MNAFVAEFSEAVRANRAALFIGAGLSQAAGLPGWNGLIEEARVDARVPEEVTDAPLAAEYITTVIGEFGLKRALLKKLAVAPVPTPLHKVLAGLNVFDYWTTNYDSLIEQAIRSDGNDVARIISDEKLGQQVQYGGKKQVFKMHGSLNESNDQWETSPVLTRTHFESYETDRPRFWAQLRAQFLTRSFLFLGLSFEDPNVNVLLRLARSLGPGSGAVKHWALMKRETGATEVELQKLRVEDLRKAGINVHLIDDFSVQDELLADIATRTRNPNVFVSGSKLDEDAIALTEQLASRVAEDRSVAVLDFGGPAAFVFGSAFKRALGAGEYQPERIRHYYRAGSEIKLDERIGTAIFTDLALPEMRDYVIPRVRAMVVVGGGARTLEEAELARQHNVAVIPVAATGGSAQELWTLYKDAPEKLNLPVGADDRRWGRLAEGGALTVQAAYQLLRSAMFE